MGRQGKSTFPRGVSLIETVVVLGVIAILVSLSLVAVQHSRAAARRLVCENNLHNIRLAMRRFRSLRQRIPNPAPAAQAGGWVVELMPFMEETNLADQLLANPSLDPASRSQLVLSRPSIFACPSSDERDSDVAGVPAAHYLMVLSKDAKTTRRSDFGVSFWHAGNDSKIPWPAGPERIFEFPSDRDEFEVLREIERSVHD